MEPKEVLIRILSKFDDAGAKAAEASIKQLKNLASQAVTNVASPKSSGNDKAQKDLQKILMLTEQEKNAFEEAKRAASEFGINLENATLRQIKSITALRNSILSVTKTLNNAADSLSGKESEASIIKNIKESIQSRKTLLTLTKSLERNLLDEAKAAEKSAVEMAKLGKIDAGTASEQVIKTAIQSRKTLLTLTGQLERALIKEAKATTAAADAEKRFTLGDLFSKFNKGTASANSFSNALKRVAGNIKSTGGSFLSILNPLAIFNTGFGRVTLGLATWEVWRNIKYGFEAMADAAVTANAKMQTAMGAFTAFSGGSTESAQTFIDILKRMSVETGVAFDALLEGSKALPTKIGQNFKAFEDIVKTAIALGFLDPAQGVEGAFFALRNALEGGAQGLRSLIQRFEIGTVSEFNEALEETGDVLSALQLMLQKTGLDVDSFIGSQRDTFPVVLQSIKSILRELIRISTSKVFTIITDNLVKVRDFLQENQAKLEAVANVISEKLVVAYQMLAGFIRDVILGGQELTAGGVFNAIVDGINWVLTKLESLASNIIAIFNIIANGFNSIFGGGQEASATNAAAKRAEEVSFGTNDNASASKAANAAAKKLEDTGYETTEAIKDTVDEVVDKIADIPVQATGGIISALTAIKEGGKETIKRFVEGMTEGLSSESLARVRDAILDNVINLEGQELAQEKSVKMLEDWVDEAAKEVEKARDRLQLFDANSADIPERYTRARRRQLEADIRSAEMEERRRKEALDAAKEQLQVTKDILAAQRDILRNIESAISAAADSADSVGSGIDMGFNAPTKDLEAFKKKVEEFTAIFRDRLQPTFTRLREDFEKLSELLRGMFGADTTQKFNEFYNIGKNISDTIGNISDKIMGVIDSMDAMFLSIVPGWEKVDPGVRKFLLFVVGYTAIKAVVIPLTFEIAKWALGATIGAVGAKLWAALLTSLGAAGAALGAAGAGVAAAFFISVGILITEVIWGWPELERWFSSERPKELTAVIKFVGTETLNKLLQLFGIDPITVDIDGKQVVPEGGLEATGFGLTEISNAIGKELSEMAKGTAFDDVGKMIEDTLFGIGKTLAGSNYDIKESADEGLKKPIIKTAEEIEDELVGHSIFPDMMQAIYDLFGDLPTRLSGPLVTLSATISQSMTGIKMQWMADWEEMVQSAVNAMNEISIAQEGLQAATVSATAGSGNQSSRQLTPYESLRISLNAAETRRLMQEGVAEGMTDVARGLRGTSGYSGR